MTTIKFNDIDISKFKVTKPRDGAKMKTFFIDYDNELFTVQTPKFLLDWGGVPKKDAYHKTDADCRYVMYGITAQNKAKTRETASEHSHRTQKLKQFEEWLLDIEEWIQSDTVSKVLFGKTSGDFIPLIRDGKPNKIKFKFYCDRDTNDPSFDLYESTGDKCESQSTSGLSIEDLRSGAFKFMTNQRLIIQFRGWTDKLVKRNQLPRYGLMMVIKGVEYSARNTPQKTNIKDEFIDTSDDE